jgi:hypothetical protein
MTTPRRPSAAAALLALCLAAAATFACKRKQPAAAGAHTSAPSSVAAQRFCPQDLSGVWVNASDNAYGYRLRDHGDVVDGVFFHRAPDGGTLAPEPTEEPITLDLHRTPTALAGAMHTFDRSQAGRRCPVEFGLSVSACNAGSLQIVSEIAAPIGEDCARLREADGGEAPADLAEYIWERPDAGR